MQPIPQPPARTFPPCPDLHAFVAELERRGRLARIRHPISVRHEITEIHRRVLSTQGPALLFEKPILADGSEAGMPVLANLFGTVERVAWGLGIEPERLEDLGEFLAELRQPHTPRSAREAMHMLPLARAGLAARTSTRRPGEWTTASGVDVDLSALPIQWCWPDEPAPLITWPLVITSSPEDPDDVNVGVYRMQVLDKRNLIVRWLAHRGGARHHREWQQLGKDMPIAIAIGADPATILAAVMPLPEGVSELAFSGLLRGTRTPVTHGATVPLSVPSTAEIVLEGFVSAFETAPEGPYGDHTGYYNSVDLFPVVRLTAVRRRRSAMYLTTFTGRPPDEPSRLGEALTPLFVPLAKRQFPEIRDLWLPPEACSYRMMVVSIDKRYPGQARRLMMGLWSMLPQFTYTKIIVVVDGDIDVRRWDDVVWALSTRFDAPRDLVVVENTPMDYLDFASTRSGLGGKVGFDATNKIGPETDREWGRVLRMSAEIRQRVDDIWDSLGLEGR